MRVPIAYYWLFEDDRDISEDRYWPTTRNDFPIVHRGDYTLVSMRVNIQQQAAINDNHDGTQHGPTIHH